jgi:hypothetical protein
MNTKAGPRRFSLDRFHCINNHTQELDYIFWLQYMVIYIHVPVYLMTYLYKKRDGRTEKRIPIYNIHHDSSA